MLLNTAFHSNIKTSQKYRIKGWEQTSNIVDAEEFVRPARIRLGHYKIFTDLRKEISFLILFWGWSEVVFIMKEMETINLILAF